MTLAEDSSHAISLVSAAVEETKVRELLPWVLAAHVSKSVRLLEFAGGIDVREGDQMGQGGVSDIRVVCLFSEDAIMSFALARGPLSDQEEGTGTGAIAWNWRRRCRESARGDREGGRRRWVGI